jgi:hypothetical protein
MKKPAVRANSGYFSGLLIENVYVWGSRSVTMQLKNMQPPSQPLGISNLYELLTKTTKHYG